MHQHHGRSLVGAAHRYRHHGDERPVRLVTAFSQPRPERARAQRQDHVVDGAPRRVLDRLHPAQRHRLEPEAAVGGEGVVENGAGRGERQRGGGGVGGGEPVAQLQRHLDGVADRSHGHGRLLGERPQSVAEHFGVGGDAVGNPGCGGLGLGVTVGRDVEQGHHQLFATRAVDGGVVHLGDEPDEAPLDPVDDPRLPQRSGAIEGDGDQISHQSTQLGRAAGGGHGDVAKVPVEVEVGVFDPQRVVQAERYLHESPAERRGLVETAGEQLADPLETPRAFGACVGGGVHDDERRHVHERRRGLEVEEPGVESGQSLHVLILP